MKYLFYFAITGWLCSFTVHFLSIFDFDISEKIPFVWLLHVGIFIVWIPTILELNKNEEFRKANRGNPKKALEIVFRNKPTWLMVIVIGCFFYALANFYLFMISQLGSTSIQDGHFVLQNHGKVIKTLTEQEYHHYKANELRGFSGHWLAFYGFATAALFPVKFMKNQ